MCARCRGNAHDSLVRLPDLVEHIRSHVVPGSASPDGVHVRGTRTPPAPLSLAAVDDADALHSMLVAWCTEVMDGRDLTGPTWRGTMVLPASKRFLPAVHRSTCPGGRCKGCAVAYDPPRGFGLAMVPPIPGTGHMDRSDPSRVRQCLCLRPGQIGPHTPRCVRDGWTQPPAADPEVWTATTALVDWLRPHMAWVATQPWAADFVAELTSEVATKSNRWSLEERPVRLSTPCPACDRLSLSRFAPRFYTGAVSIRCTARDCGEPIPEAHYGLYTRVVVANLVFEDPEAAYLYRLEVTRRRAADVYVARRALQTLRSWIAKRAEDAEIPAVAPLIADAALVAEWVATFAVAHAARTRLDAIRGFYQWAVAEHLIEADPSAGIEVADEDSTQAVGGAA
ncbi:hypothetical protein [Kineosporia sp. R_H_3]|uniref:hypothetical protein n=1 Tax=Kineosporia sp. R_H_3 TaxID=1961848 RepID=UPI000B4B6917|nr:hypothetical protein [Kineosporia sp. R_H_3]